MKISVPLLLCFLISCSNKGNTSKLDYKEELSKPLTEISGMVADGNVLWAITDKPHAKVYKLDLKGKLQQEITVNSAEATDVEAVTKDNGYVYIGDVGDNDGNREERQIIRVSKLAI